MRIETQHFCKAGSCHKNMECGDVFSTESGNGITAISLCDGAGFSLHGREAAETASAFISRNLVEHFRDFLYDPSEIILTGLAAEIEREMRITAELKGINVEEMASTIMAAATDGVNHVCIHMGDGLILMHCQRDRLYKAVSLPQNGPDIGSTYLTMNCNMSSHLRLYRWSSNDLQDLMLMTDGAAKCVKAYKHDNTAYLIPCKNLTAFETKLSRLKPKDDFSCATINIR